MTPRGRPPTTTAAPRDRLTVQIDSDLKRDLLMACASEGVAPNVIVDEALRAYLSRSERARSKGGK
jgi:hypothetical protein